ncbi:MAG: hypothetical protein H6Q20_1580 [Bacteroidetes bacterium]|nr:hypothetical protein [Bacteroidota bacterium]
MKLFTISPNLLIQNAKASKQFHKKTKEDLIQAISENKKTPKAVLI